MDEVVRHQSWAEKLRQAARVTEQRNYALMLCLLFGLGLFSFGTLAITNAYNAYRFTHHAETVDAYLVERLGTPRCLSASGGIFGSGHNTWLVEFPTRKGLHRTELRHYCDVLPPDFGRGRGYMWMQYDVDNPDRTRVLNDTKAEDNALPSSLAAGGWLIGGLLWLRWAGLKHLTMPFSGQRRTTN